MKPINNKGFTLVELSIVIVIIGFIIAGVTAGQALVKQAQLRSILTQADQIRGATNAFKMQYNGYPGDITNASSFWAFGCLSTGAIGSASVAGDCNGDGNKQISTASKGSAVSMETYMAWYQLSRAGLFPGSYVPGVNTAVGTLNTNIPAARYPGTGITLGYDTNQMTGINIGKNIILFGAVNVSIANAPVLTPGQASSLDVKADDGNAEHGSIYGGNAGALANCESVGVYVLTTTIAACTLGFAL